ncbi:MAG: response regulator transcription factor [Bacteroidales bacterium]|nr:response regulator transcription factor [Bacteroidales bacterium]
MDDNAHAVKQIEKLMLKYDYFRHAGSETSPEKAIPLILSQRPDILFIDVEMPVMTGLDVVTKIQKEGYLPLVIFVTAYEKYAVQAIRKAAFDYLLKPVDKIELDMVIKRLREYYAKNDASVDNKLVSILTHREKDVFEMLRHCMTSIEIAERLNISPETVYTYRRRIIKKLNLNSTREILVRYPLPGK